MGAVVFMSVDDVKKYGELGIRYNSLREFYKCIRNVINKVTKDGDVRTCT